MLPGAWSCCPAWLKSPLHHVACIQTQRCLTSAHTPRSAPSAHPGPPKPMAGAALLRCAPTPTAHQEHSTQPPHAPAPHARNVGPHAVDFRLWDGLEDFRDARHVLLQHPGRHAVDRCMQPRQGPSSRVGSDGRPMSPLAAVPVHLFGDTPRHCCSLLRAAAAPCLLTSGLLRAGTGASRQDHHHSWPACPTSAKGSSPLGSHQPPI